MKVSMIVTTAAFLGSAAISYAQLVGTASISQPITPVADATHVLVTAPYCPGSIPFGVYDITSGTPQPFSNLSALVPSECQEIAVAISPGLAGFLPGWVYVVYPNLSNTVSIARIPPTGGAPQPWLTLPINVPSATLANLGVTFDVVGSFGNSLLVTTGTGQVVQVNAAGTFSIHQVSGAGCCGVELESPRVAPMGFGAYGGYLFATGESPASLFAIQPGTFTATALPAGPALSPRPESVAFGSGFGTCSVSVGPNHTPATLFDSVYGQGYVAFYNVAVGNAGFINSEYNAGGLGLPYGILAYLNPDGSVGTQIAQFNTQQEHLNTVTPRTDTPSCTPVPPRGCTLTQGGYKNHFNNLVTGLTLGNVSYTAVQINDILQNNAVKGNGLISLAHQLITAQLNLNGGAIPSNTTQYSALLKAINDANTLIGNLVVPPVGNGYLDPSQTSAIESILDVYNNGNFGVSHCE